MKAKARMLSPEVTLERLSAGKRERVTGWDVQTIGDALTDAFFVLRKVPEKDRAKAVRTAWPDDTFAKDPHLIKVEAYSAAVAFIGQYGAEQWDEDRKEIKKVIVLPDSHRISQMEKAITWPMKYVQHPMFRLIVLTVSITWARGGNVNKLCREMGWAYSTTNNRFNKACEQIADGLERDAVPCWRQK